MDAIILKRAERRELERWVRGQSRDAAQGRRARLTIELQEDFAGFDRAYPEGADYVIVPAMLYEKNADPAVTSWIAGLLNVPFEVDGFGTALIGALIITVVSWFVNVVLPDKLEAH